MWCTLTERECLFISHCCFYLMLSPPSFSQAQTSRLSVTTTEDKSLHKLPRSPCSQSVCPPPVLSAGSGPRSCHCQPVLCQSRAGGTLTATPTSSDGIPSSAGGAAECHTHS